MSSKHILMRPEENQYEPPKGLLVDENFKRLGILNPAVIQDEENPSRITLFPRLIYQDKHGLNSCIIKKEAILEGKNIRIRGGEETVFQSKAPHGLKGVEDFRVCKIKGEKVLHGDIVYFNGFDARTKYVRTKKSNPKNYSDWDEFGIYFPNINAEKAIELVEPQRYKEYWENNFGKIAQEKAREFGVHVPEVPYLGTKDCCVWPNKVKRKNDKGIEEEYYAKIIRLLPDMQIIYFKDFRELANVKFWENVVSNIEEHNLLKRKNGWEKSHIGLAGAPIELEEGILLPYHGVKMNPIRDYKFGAALQDKEDPQITLARTKKPILYATEPWERNGVVDGDVVFPTGHARGENGTIHLFYGAGDKYLAHTTTTEKKILEQMVDA